MAHGSIARHQHRSASISAKWQPHIKAINNGMWHNNGAPQHGIAYVARMALASIIIISNGISGGEKQ
jgi:N-acetylneuraminic acid mutarotase